MARPKNTDTPEGRKRQEEKYHRILNAALVVFAQNGFNEARISDIAQEAGVGDGTIYLYFKNKDDLLISLFEAKLEEINNGLRMALENVFDSKSRLNTVIKYHLGLAVENPDLAALVTNELRRSSKFMKEYAKEQLAEYLDQWAEVFEEGKRKGIFSSELSTSVLKQLLFGALDHACGIWVNNPKRRPEDLIEVGNQLYLLVLGGLRNLPNLGSE